MSRNPLKVGDRTKVRGVEYLVIGIRSSRDLGSKFYGKGRVLLRDRDGNEVSVFCSLPASNISNCKPSPLQDWLRESIVNTTGRP